MVGLVKQCLKSCLLTIRCRYATSSHKFPASRLAASSCQNKLYQKFKEAGISEPEVSAEFIIAHVLGRKTLFSIPAEHELSESQWKTAIKLSSERLKSVPIQYILGEWDFRDSTLKMRAPVFIPRPETEELVSLILKDSLMQKAENFLEIGCGSGAISVSLLKENPKLQGTAVDLSSEACELTTENAQKNDVHQRLKVIQMKINQDLLNLLQKSYTPKIYDLIVSNPPYVPTCDIPKLQPEIHRYEDDRAFHGGNDGMDVIKLVLQMAPLVLKPMGSLWLEVDSKHPPWIQSYLRANQSTLPNLSLKHTYDDFMDISRFCHLQHLPTDFTPCSCRK